MLKMAIILLKMMNYMLRKDEFRSSPRPGSTRPGRITDLSCVSDLMQRTILFHSVFDRSNFPGMHVLHNCCHLLLLYQDVALRLQTKQTRGSRACTRWVSTRAIPTILFNFV